MRAILTYHSIDESGSPISIARDEFDRHVAWLASGQVKVVPLDRLASDPGPDLVAITFDDGFKNFALSAAPRLAERGLPVTLFIVSDRAGLTNAWGDRPAPGIPNLELLTWDQIRQLAESGVAIGSHTRRHPRLTRLGPEQLDDELAGSADRIERELGSRPRWFAYPYGDVDPEVSRRARSQPDAEQAHLLPPGVDQGLAGIIRQRRHGHLAGADAVVTLLERAVEFR